MRESKKIEAPSLEEAYKKASSELGCSITDLEIEVLQYPSKGFLGLGKKNAIILATCKKETKEEIKEEITQKAEENVEDIKKEAITKEEKKPVIAKEKRAERTTPVTLKKEESSVEKKVEKEKPVEVKTEEKPAIEEIKKREIPVIKNEFEEFYQEKESIEDIAKEVEEKINDLFKEACFELDKVIVKPYDENTLLIEFSGPDSALLIGKEGYRYKALSYMLFNWINSRYNFQIRLEIAEFLKSQEEMIRNYLKPLIEKIKKEGRGQTKPLDGVLVQIALKELREVFPDKYVAIRTNRQGEKYIIVNEFNRKNE